MPDRKLEVTRSVSWVAVGGRCSHCQRLFDVPCLSLEYAGKANRKLVTDFRNHSCDEQANQAGAQPARAFALSAHS